MNRETSGAANVWLLAVSVLASLLLAEVGLSLLGKRFAMEVDGDEPTVHEPHPVLGWRARPGDHRIPPYSEGAPEIRFRIGPAGQRATSAAGEFAGKRDTVLFVGGSYTQGWAISDDETFAWKLQGRFRNAELINYGTSAYGTHQAALSLEGHLARDPRPPRGVVYGLFGFVWMQLCEEFKTREQGWICFCHPNIKRSLLLPRPEPRGPDVSEHLSPKVNNILSSYLLVSFLPDLDNLSSALVQVEKSRSIAQSPCHGQESISSKYAGVLHAK